MARKAGCRAGFGPNEEKTELEREILYSGIDLYVGLNSVFMELVVSGEGWEATFQDGD